MDGIVELISRSYTTDALQQRVAVETSREVWAHISSVSRSEFFQAGQNGLKPEVVVTTPLVNYCGEELCNIGSKRYHIYRTYFSDRTDEIELYCEERVSDVQH